MSTVEARIERLKKRSEIIKKALRQEDAKLRRALKRIQKDCQHKWGDWQADGFRILREPGETYTDYRVCNICGHKQEKSVVHQRRSYY